MQKEFKRDINSLDKIFTFNDKFVKKNNIDASIAFTINLVIEELFTNMVKYNAEGPRDIIISLKKNKNRLVMSLTDFDAKPFDITKTDEVDVNERIEERKPGGLGLHLTKQMVDKIDYDYKDRKSKITLIKNLEKKDV